MLPTSKTEKLTWPDGNWWEFRTFLPVSLEREMLELGQGAIDFDSNGNPVVDLKNPDQMARIHKLDDMLVLKSTVGWSYGLITKETLENDIPSFQYDQAMARMLELYRPLIASSVKKQLGSFTLPLSEESRSQQTTSSPTTFSKPDGHPNNSNEPIESLWKNS